MPHTIIAEFERLIRRDPARRGLIGSESSFTPLGLGELAGAAHELAGHGRAVGIITGFFVPGGDPPAAETDGPPGAVVLANALRAIGVRTRLITDARCAPALAAIAAASGVSDDELLVLDGTEGWDAAPLASFSHLIAIERIGPSHTRESLTAKRRSGAPPVERFESGVPPDRRGRCHNMRGEMIDECTAPLHRLFENPPPGVKTIGIGDGGNEIGMGALCWEDLICRLSGPQSAWVPCRIATDWNIIAGTSNWGAYALAAAVLVLRDAIDVLGPWDGDHELAVLQAMVESGPAVDGITRRREPTVDGLPFLTYIQPWEGMRRLLELDG